MVPFLILNNKKSETLKPTVSHQQCIHFLPTCFGFSYACCDGFLRFAGELRNCCLRRKFSFLPANSFRSVVTLHSTSLLKLFPLTLRSFWVFLLCAVCGFFSTSGQIKRRVIMWKWNWGLSRNNYLRSAKATSANYIQWTNSRKVVVLVFG